MPYFPISYFPESMFPASMFPPGAEGVTLVHRVSRGVSVTHHPGVAYKDSVGTPEVSFPTNEDLV